MRREKWGTARPLEHGGEPMPASIVRAERDLVDALAGVQLDDDERRTVDWLMSWDQPTLHRLASIVRKARAAGPVDGARGADL